MTTRVPISQKELAEIAFDLLTSSSPHRYIRMAKRAAMRSRVQEHLKADPEMILPLVGHARKLWGRLLGSEQRDVPECELALILPILAHTAAPEVDGLLMALALVDRPTVAWIAALARALLQERASNMSRADLVWGIAHRQLYVTKSQSQNQADGRVEEAISPDLHVISSEDSVSQEEDIQWVAA